jgi:hypothetical protein
MAASFRMETSFLGCCTKALPAARSGTENGPASPKFAPALAMTAGGKLERAIA